MLLAIGAYVAIVAIGQLLMPGLEAAPEGFPSPVIWHFRVATVGIHAVIWATLGLVFGALAQPRGARRATPSTESGHEHARASVAATARTSGDEAP